MFTEKIQWRILNDRRELLGLTCDKLKSKEFAEAADVGVPRTYWHGTDVRELADVTLPAQWVLKPNHRSGSVYFGAGAANVPHLLEVTDGWLRDAQSLDLGEWAYSQADPALLVEEALGTQGQPPADYKIFVFDGDPKLVQVDTDRHGDHRKRFYTTDWQPLMTSQVCPLGEIQPRPRHLEEMLLAAGRLGKSFDFIRVDLYADDDAVMFGEFSAYPGGGIDRYSPRNLDRLLGSYWHLPSADCAR
jgi:hypothetical protein